MSDITETVRQLRSRNDHAPIFKLLDELLSSIFLVLAPSWSCVPHSTFEDVRAISQVCFRWRIISLYLPNLWKSLNLDEGTLEWRKEMFRRSANAPSLEINTGYRCNEILDIPDGLSRIRYFSGDVSIKVWVALFDNARQLEHLWIHPSSEALWEPVALPFHGHVPPLRLFHCERRAENLNLSSPFFSNVRDLNIGRSRLFISEFKAIVENMPFLERLQAVAETGVTIDNPLPCRIPIPRLRYLRCRNYNLFKCIDDLHQECRLGLCSSSWEENDEAITSFVPRLIFDHTQNKNTWLCVYVIANNVHIGNLNGFHSTELCNSDHISIHTLHNGQWRWQSVLQDIIPRLAAILPTITKLRLEFILQNGREGLVSFLSHFTGVRDFYFGTSDESMVFRYLKQPYDNGSGPRMLLPLLETFHFLQNYRWEQGVAAEFKSYLAWRIEQGAPIKFVKGFCTQPDSLEEWGRFRKELESVYNVLVNIKYLKE